MDRPMVSICIPAYREVDLLCRAIASCQIQDFKDFEVVVSDDTEDESVRLLVEPLAVTDARIRYFRNPGPHGAAANSNHAAQMARGEWLKFLYQDDEFATADSLRCFLAHAEGADLVSSANYQCREGRRTLRAVAPEMVRLLRDAPVETLAKYGNQIGAPSVVMMKKRVFQGFHEDMVWMFDMLLYIKTMHSGALYRYLDMPLIVIHEHPGQLTHAVQDDLAINFRERKKILMCLFGTGRYTCFVGPMILKHYARHFKECLLSWVQPHPSKR